MNDRSHYYMKRLKQGWDALNRGVRDTPLVTALQRWGFYGPTIQVGDYVVPAAWESYANGIREIIDAIDEEDRQAPFRFQLVGEFWEIHFMNHGVLERGIFLDHRGFQHYSRLLQEPDREVPSLVLDGRAMSRTTAQAEIDVLSRFSRQEEMGEEEIRILVAKIEKLNQQMREAKDSGDLDQEQALFVKKEKLWDSLHDQEGDTLGTILPQQGKRLLGPASPGRKAHKTVARAMSRALDVLRDPKRKMPALVRFLERTVDSTGNAFVYRPDPPAPKWLL